MRKVVFLAALLLAVGGSALAAESGNSLDLSGSIATEPRGGFDTGWGFDVGANIDFDTMNIKVNLPPTMKVQARASLGYYKWTDDNFGNDLKYRRIPFDLGGRFVYSINPQLKAHGDLAVEVSFDKRDVFRAGTETDTRIGLVPGVGIAYYVNNIVYLGADARYHAITDDYYTFGATVGFNFQ